MSEPVESEVIETTSALAVRPSNALPTVQDLEQQFELAVRQRELLSQYIKKQLVPGKHFYQRGTQKPSLAKEGAEIILLPHNLAPDYDQIGGPDSPPADGRPYQITVKCVLRRKGDPTSFVGSGIGSAGSEKQKKDGSYIHRQEDKYLCHNATLKMAQKSAMIAATINSTAASEFFTQDMDEPGQAEPDHPHKPGSHLSTVTDPNAPRTATEVRQTMLPRTPQSAPASPSKVPESAALPVFRPATDQTRDWMILELSKVFTVPQITDYFRAIDWLLPEHEDLGKIELRYVANTKSKLRMLITRMEQFLRGDKAEPPYAPDWEGTMTPEQLKAFNDLAKSKTTSKVKITERELTDVNNMPPEDDLPMGDEPWRVFPMPFGKNAGIPLGKLGKKYLFGLWANYTVETEYKGNPKKPETIAKDNQFRAMLDLAGAHHQFTKKDPPL